MNAPQVATGEVYANSADLVYGIVGCVNGPGVLIGVQVRVRSSSSVACKYGVSIGSQGTASAEGFRAGAHLVQIESRGLAGLAKGMFFRLVSSTEGVDQFWPRWHVLSSGANWLMGALACYSQPASMWMTVSGIVVDVDWLRWMAGGLAQGSPASEASAMEVLTREATKARTAIGRT